jgi:PAS domain S-box-containing protein
MKSIFNKYFAGVLGAVLIFTAIGVISYVNLDKDENAGIDAALSYEIIHELKEIQNYNKDISLARRGFIMSGDELFLEPYQPLKNEISEKMRLLLNLTADNSVQNKKVKLLKKLVEDKLVLSELSINLFKKSLQYDQTQQLLTSNGKVSNFTIELLLKNLEEEQRIFLETQIAKEDSAESLIRKIVVTGNLIALFMFIISFLFAFKQQKQKEAEAETRRKKEEELKNKQIELETLWNILPIGVFYVNNSEECSYVNESWCKMTGYTIDEVRGTNLVNLIHPEDRERTFDAFIEALSSGSNFHEDYRYICKNGDVKFVIGEIAARKDINGNLLGFIGTVFDMTQQHIFQEELVKYNTLFESVAEGVPDPIFVKDLTGRYDFINTAGAEVIGKSIEDIIGKRDSELFSPEIAEKILSSEEQFYKNKEVVNYEVSTVLPNGSIKTYLSTRGLIHNSKNKPIGLFGVMRDITAIKEKELQIIRSLKEKETLLRETHHRVKNNLQVVASLLKLQSGYIKDTDSKKYFDDSRGRIGTIAALHEKLYGSQKYTKIELKRYVEQLIEMSSTSLGIDSNRIKIKANIEDVSIDVEYSVPVGLVINEILTNSIKYAFPGKRKGEISINISKNLNELYIEIGDNGVGLSEKLDVANLESLGLQLIFTLVESQLGGKVKFIPAAKGLVFGMNIPIKETVYNKTAS